MSYNHICFACKKRPVHREGGWCLSCHTDLDEWELMFEWSKCDFSKYWEFEEKEIRPIMEMVGHKNVTFEDGERDSFGPLSRIVLSEYAGEKRFYFYG